MSKINQNKITFTLILASITIIFSSLTILSLPVLFNYKSKVAVIENNFYKSFKIYLDSANNITYKPFPKPHLLVENGSIKLSKFSSVKIVEKSTIKIFISLRDIYLRSFNNLETVEVSNSNIKLNISDMKKIREHLYKNINNPIIFNNCKIFIKNKQNEVIIISPIKKILYKIHEKNKTKSFSINGKVFGFNYKSEWKRSYSNPKNSFHNINIFNPNIDIKNTLIFEDKNKFKGNSQISYDQNKLEYDFNFDKDNIDISSPNKKKINFKLDSKIQLSPFYFQGELKIENKKIEKIIDIILLNLLTYDESYLGNFNGKFTIKFDDMDNKLLKKGEISFIVNEKKINLNEAKFSLDKIGNIITTIKFVEEKGDIKFYSKNKLIIDDHIEFAKIFQIGSKRVKNIKVIYFDLEKEFGTKDFSIQNIKINDIENNYKTEDIFIVKNIQSLRAQIRKIID